ncbi:MAG: threonylcarbamoyl-AMP synthase [Chlamydiia bacterium]|nr:threonylcarbamoyl-AMP synthase [Chlamydiia bacterium]
MQIERAASALKAGEVVIIPTETVYGLAACVHLPGAVQKIFQLKRRPADNPLIVHVASVEEALSLIEPPPEEFFLLANRFWPGPLTLVVRKRSSVTDLVSAGLPSIALRMPAHPLALALIQAAGPLAAPSANLSGKPSPTTLQDALEDFGDQVPITIDGGPCAIGIESTVVSLWDKTPTLLRPGYITPQTLEAVLGKPLGCQSEGPVLSPGMKYRHYAPKAPVRLIYDPQQLTARHIIHTPRQETLYADLRRLDREKAPEIQIYCDAKTRADQALMDRLIRASS